MYALLHSNLILLTKNFYFWVVDDKDDNYDDDELVKW